MIRTRFAPSPTGYLHIGGVRTALFCWLFARRHGGKFVLRIDDTDRQRNLQEALAPILDGLRWLGIEWDEGPGVGGPYGPYFQSQREKLYEAAVEELLRRGRAYWDYATVEEIQAEREEAQREKRDFLYSRRFIAETPDQRERFEAMGRKAVVRLKMPRQGTLVIDDLVRGKVEFQWAREQDHVVRRSDGSCLYHLASTVDDHDMEITHVIRAEEHLSNTPRQIFIAQSLGYELPRYAHLPFVAEPGSKNKLSKRKLKKYLKNRDFAALVEHGEAIAEKIGLQTSPEQFNPVIVDFYRRTGFLPGAIVNYLALLGWSLDDKSEHFNIKELIENFSLDRVNKAPASFDPKKLQAFEQRHMQELPRAEKQKMVMPFLQRAGYVPSPASGSDEAKVEAVVAAAGDRIKVAGDVLEFDEFFTPDDELQFDEKVLEKRLARAKPATQEDLQTCAQGEQKFQRKTLKKPPDAVDLLAEFKDMLAVAESFDAEALERLLHDFVAERDMKIGRIIHALRVAVTGKGVGVGMFDAMAVLGKQSCLARIERALAACGYEKSAG